MILFAGATADGSASAESGWETIGDIGQTVGAFGTVIAVLALLGAMRSLQLQRRQTHASEEEVLRAMRYNLMILALQHEKYLPLWGFPPSLPQEEMALRAYLGMMFSYFEAGLRNGRMTERELDQSLSNLFHIKVGRDFWHDHRDVYLESGDPSAVRLARIADRHCPPASRTDEPAAGPHDVSRTRDVTGNDPG
ncbi:MULTISPECIES: DUF6082 family protein [Catenuloplanes]|uniref:Uncharacterized protein n=1 Tax=Catenuloplanes niger TaxID=587534 RepID=A0AAE4CXF4_9ACTN|nr:DUF6082 family protein [Catenuloplanes niger]MDR7328165.1 hypothetical protein [Catenuloplanes niger]